MTGPELVLSIFPTATKSQVESLLWGGTLFPFLIPPAKEGDEESIVAFYRGQLEEWKEKSGGDPEKALVLIDQSWTEAHENGKRRMAEYERDEAAKLRGDGSAPGEARGVVVQHESEGKDGECDAGCDR